MITRWCRATIDADGWPRELRVLVRNWAIRLELGDGTGIFRCEVEEADLATVQQAVTVFPSLSTPVSKLPAGIRTWLASHGVLIEPEDQVLNLLRKLRDAKGAQFDVSQSE